MKSHWILRSLSRSTVGVCLIWLVAAIPSQVFGQFGVGQDTSGAFAAQEPRVAPVAEGEKPPSLLIDIPDEPKTIDPATLVPSVLAVKVTVSFDEKPLRDIVKWLQEEQSINVLVDNPALSDEGILVGEPITDHLEDAPLYLLLNRLQSMQLDWYFEEDTLFITTRTKADGHFFTNPYNLGEFFDDGYQPQALLQMIRRTTPSKWEDDDGEGGATVLLGDVLFVRQTVHIHRQVVGLLSALRKHGRRTFTDDPPEHKILRQKLNDPVSVEFDETPLKSVIKQLADQVQVDIRLDSPGMRAEGISDRVPVTMKMTERPLSSVLRTLLMKFQLTWVYQDGLLLITTEAYADEIQKSAIFDVRDLCQNPKESAALMYAIRTQTRSHWNDVDGQGGFIISPKPGVLVIRNTERALEETSQLLESYRSALRISKPRKVAEVDPKELLTRYYRMQKEVAADLEKLLPEMIQPVTWKSPAQPDATGTIRSVTSRSELLRTNSADASKTPATNTEAFVLPNSVLIIHQTRENHDAIAKLIRKVHFGEIGENVGVGGLGGGMGGGGMGGGMGGGGGGGMGGGGFGGGFFAVPTK